MVMGFANVAQSDEADRNLVMTVGIFSQYVFRGLTQTNRGAAIQGGADYAAGNGLHVGAWLSNINWFSDMNPGTTSPVEWDLYAGLKRRILGEVSCDLGVLRYAFPGRYPALPAGTVRPDTTEPYLGLQWRWLSMKFAWTTDNTFGVADSVGSHYADVTVTVPLWRTLTGEIHAGRQVFRGVGAAAMRLRTTNDALYTYTDYRITMTYVIRPGWSASLTHTDTDAPDAGYRVLGRSIGAQQTVIGVTRTF
jgi:uncharacterized protein (TIGR02001 family)